jgi:transcriptional regulator with XRE-family HTH domain
VCYTHHIRDEDRCVKHAEMSVIVRVDVVGNRIADRLRGLGISKTEAARRSGLSLRTIQRAMDGTHPPRLDSALALALSLETSVESLFLCKVWRRRSRLIAS